MKKVQVFLREDQKAALERMSIRTGRKQSELIRNGVDLLLDKGRKEKRDWRDVTRSIAGMWKDRTDLDDFARGLREADNRRLDNPYDPS